MHKMAPRAWLSAHCDRFSQSIAECTARATCRDIDTDLHRLAAENKRIHEASCINLNPATNVMNPRAEAMLAAGLGSRPSLGYPGDKYEMGLEAIEQIEVIAQELACEVFECRFAEVRIASGAMANLYGFMATCKPGDTIIVPPADIAGHVTHHMPGAAGLYGLNIVQSTPASARYTLDLDRLRELARSSRPKLITVGGSLNLFAHPIGEIRQIADEVGAYVLYDAAHMSGMIAGRAWQQPLQEGAHLLSMSTYKSLAGPPAGLLLTDDADLAERIERIAFPGLTANFDAGNIAALALTLLDWKEFGQAYAAQMAATAHALASACQARDLPVFAAENGSTTSHQFAIEAARWGGGQTMAKRLREANLLSCGIGLPIAPVEGDVNGLRIGTPEIVRWGMGEEHMDDVAAFLASALEADGDLSNIAADVSDFRGQFDRLHFIRQA